jgi:formamidopyrimidine-DNA glycosylase
VPELPDISAYIAALEARILGQRLERVRLQSVFVLRTADPPISAVEGRTVRELRRIGKRIAIGVEGDLRSQRKSPVATTPRSRDRFLGAPVVGDPGLIWLVIHLMIAGRLHWRPPQAKLSGRQALLALDFSDGSLVLTEAGSKRRASLHVLRGETALHDIDPGGVEIFSTDLEGFRAALMQENRTLKRALTDPRLISGVGNAYSDEILHAAQLSPITLTHKLKLEEWQRLFDATRATLSSWTNRLVAEAKHKFPEGVTAFRPEMAVHGRFGQPCPRCGAPIQRIRYADNETNYCPSCQTGGKLLADRSLSRLLGSDWPRTLDELEALKRR